MTVQTAAPPRTFSSLFDAITSNVAAVLIGKKQAIELAVICLLADGHLLIEDVPGVGKTSLAKALAASLDCTFGRVQFTPDLLPSDVVGVNVWSRAEGRFEFRPGPIFAGVVLGDEINRASPKTQSALLEAMGERQVTVDGVTYPMAPPFMVIATQNPIESQGTYPLPEAQLDRFLLKLNVESPPREVEERIVKHHAQGFDPKDISSLAPASSPEEIARLQRVVGAVRVDDAIVSYMVELVRRTRDDRAIELGASPRASIAMLKAARVVAASEGRTFVTPDDIKPMVKPILRHRVMLHPDAELQGLSADDRIDAIVKATPVPRGKG